MRARPEPIEPPARQQGGSGVKRPGSRRAGGPRGAAKSTGSSEDADLETMQEALTDFSIDELREFLEADLADVPVDPEFKERLREKLWALVQERARPGPDGG